MRKVTLFIAMSLDGYIADVNGGVNWLGGQEPDGEDMETYNEFIKSVDTVIMGYHTYHQITAELSPDIWPYEDLLTYVMTHRELPETEEIKFMDMDICELVRDLRQKEGNGIWICGGASIIQPLLQDNLIDTYHISIMPVILGKGISLFREADKDLKLKLIKSQSYNGITDVIYQRR